MKSVLSQSQIHALIDWFAAGLSEKCDFLQNSKYKLNVIHASSTRGKNENWFSQKKVLKKFSGKVGQDLSFQSYFPVPLHGSEAEANERLVPEQTITFPYFMRCNVEHVYVSCTKAVLCVR